MGSTSLGRYQLLSVLGQGAMGIVYHAYDPVLDREVALKELLFPVDMDAAAVESAVARFYTEARAAARLSHPTIVTVHDVGEEYGRLFLAMELLDGATLRQILDASGRFSIEDGLYVMREVATAISTAHGAGVVHRDIKPDNCFWLRDGRVKVGDFGIARIGEQDFSRAGTIMGTPGYMAPEQVMGREAGPSADVFSWGAVAFEVLTGTPPFGLDDMDLVMQRILHDDPPDVRDLGASVPEEMARAIGRALEKDPKARYKDGGHLASDLFGIAAITSGSRHVPGGLASAAVSGRTKKEADAGPPGPRRKRSRKPAAGSSRRRRGSALPLVVMILAALGVMGLVGWLLTTQLSP